MIRLSRPVALPLVAVVVAVFAALFITVIGPGSPAVAGTQVGAPGPLTSSPCVVCVTPHDAICWEGVGPCQMAVVVYPTEGYPITVHYQTVAMTAKPYVDYVPVQDAVLTIPAGHTTAYVYIQLVSGAGTASGKQFTVAFHDIVGGQLARPQAIVTINAQGSVS